MTIASHALLSLGLPMRKVTRLMLEQRARRYPMLRELFLGSEDLANEQANAPERLHSVRIDGQCPAVGQSVEALLAHRVLLSAIVRGDQRITHPADDLIIEPGDVLVILGTPENLTRAEQWLTGVP